ncbi:39S ribosomal protein L43, mitochondrial-like [Gigantopelta aegis]|uniref:39S ribosomal protein L43, mitochondrial-like n=1 Tax=Gigantopelta aegis TaxID=1735272 RepID=UPI001B88E151|nr:39S ribosomal protein L43, mitochondrial-like [Gigantopelta aegis]
MTGRSTPSTFLKNVMQNGIGRYVCQLQRITVKFCKSSGASRGTRDFIENHLLDFTKTNPGVVVYLKPRRNRSPQLFAEYLNGRTESMNIANFTKDEIFQWVEHFRTRSGTEIMRFRKEWHTDTPSIQGVWTPFTNKDTALNVTELPNEQSSQMIPPKSASDQILEIAKQIQSKELKNPSEKE